MKFKQVPLQSATGAILAHSVQTPSGAIKKGREIFERIIAVASGEKTKSEELGYGGNEFVPWQIGATM